MEQQAEELPRAAAIVQEFKRKCCEDAGLLSVATGINWHIQLWRHQELQLDLHKEKAKDDTLYWCLDFATLAHNFTTKRTLRTRAPLCKKTPRGASRTLEANSRVFF